MILRHFLLKHEQPARRFRQNSRQESQTARCLHLQISKSYQRTTGSYIPVHMSLHLCVSSLTIKSPRISPETCSQLSARFTPCRKLSFDLQNYEKQEEVLPGEIKALVNERNNARLEKNWAESDRIRDLLIEKGYMVKDSKEGTFVEKK